MELSEEQIKEIAEELEMGFKCYLNLKTGEVKSVPNFDNWYVADTEPWDNEIEEIDANYEDYLEFEGMDSHASFDIMRDFTETVDNNRLRNSLVYALNNKKPFSNFKFEINNSGECQKWFEFRRERFIDWVKQRIL